VTDVDVRAKVRELIQTGDLPSDPPVIHRTSDGLAGPTRGTTCTICGEPDPTVSYFWPGGIAVRLHAACDALWKLERA
jgi:ribosomal protein S14